MAATNGTIRYEDLRNYRAIECDPVEGTYRGNKIFSMPPSSSGGTTLIEMLNIFENFPSQLGMEGSSDQRHHMIESMRRAFRDRAEYSADPAFFKVPIELLTSKEHARELAATIQPDRATASSSMPLENLPRQRKRKIQPISPSSIRWEISSATRTR
jgi:gamma-glutamyltranspeptidase/glutathione hydrolase